MALRAYRIETRWEKSGRETCVRVVYRAAQSRDAAFDAEWWENRRLEQGWENDDGWRSTIVSCAAVRKGSWLKAHVFAYYMLRHGSDAFDIACHGAGEAPLAGPAYHDGPQPLGAPDKPWLLGGC